MTTTGLEHLCCHSPAEIVLHEPTKGENHTINKKPYSYEMVNLLELSRMWSCTCRRKIYSRPLSGQLKILYIQLRMLQLTIRSQQITGSNCPKREHYSVSWLYTLPGTIYNLYLPFDILVLWWSAPLDLATVSLVVVARSTSPWLLSEHSLQHALQ